ncbi:MAG: carbohydrate ABC transporter substrate-binding protein [Lachnospiraceae bacterium]|nr:carbohydrate ABC transporter substrate-binding protein [Lachnospiraceae bacterium]
MRKKLLSLGLASLMALSLVACGGGKKAEEATMTDDGKVLNIQVWNDEWKTRVEDYYPGYEKVDENTGKIGDVDVVWTVTPNADNAYQNHLDDVLSKQADADADDKVDIFLIEADYALKYVDSSASLSMDDLGITADDLGDQYKYTQDIVTDSEGKMKGASWQGCPGLMIYNREIAKDVFGTDDPDKIQESFSDWDKFQESAAKLKKKGYKVTASANDTYRTFSNNVTTKWVEDGELKYDDNLMKWVDMSKEMVDAGQTTTADLWGDDWSKGFYPAGNVFCYFGPAWFIDFCMAGDVKGSVGFDGGWAATEGPQGFYWGGTWICGANGTDNSSLVKDIMLQMSTNDEILTKIVTEKSDFVNDKEIMESFADNKDFGDKILGGQNPIGKFCAGIEGVDLSNITAYDQGCNEEFQNNMKDYFDGNCTKEEAIEKFEQAVKEKYPELDK